MEKMKFVYIQLSKKDILKKEQFIWKDKSKKYIIFGAGIQGRKVKKNLELNNEEVSVWCDNNSTLWGKIIDEKEVISPDELIEEYKNEIIIITTGGSILEVGKQLVKKGIPVNNLITTEDDWMRVIYDEEYTKEAILHYPPLSVTIGITSACNNRCLFCSYHGEDAKGKSSVYNLPYMLSYSKFVKMVDMIVAGGVKKIHICGTGEPFLNPDILKMIDYVIEKTGRVSFQTNFWKELFDKKNYLEEIVKRADYIESITTDVCSSIPKEHNYIKKGSSYGELLNAMEYLGKNSKISLRAFLILTKSNCTNVKGIIDDFIDRGIENFELGIGNLFSYDFSEFTSSDNVYISTDYEITNMLNDLVKYGKEKGVFVTIPEPADKTSETCGVFWTKFQTWPTCGCEKERYDENMISHACAAVVKGDVKSFGYLLDYENLMDAWNSETLVKIRTNLLKGKYPSEHCKNCYCYHLEDSYYKNKVKDIIGNRKAE